MSNRLCSGMLAILSLMAWDVSGQDSGNALSQAGALDDATFTTNRLLQYMCQIGECPLPPVSSRTEFFAPEALIFTSSRNRREVCAFSPAIYFRRVNGFVCHRPQKYRYLRFSYSKVDQSMARVIPAKGKGYLICVKVDQQFEGGDSETSIAYSDDTIKDIYLRVYLNEQGNIESRIVQITAEPPTELLRPKS